MRSTRAASTLMLAEEAADLMRGRAPLRPSPDQSRF